MGPEKKSPGQTGGTWPGLRRFKAATRCRLQVTGGLAPAVGLHCAPSATFVEQSFLDQPRVQKIHYANSEIAEAARPRLPESVVTFLNSLPCRHSTSAVARLLCDLLRAGAAQTLSDEA